jgi:hypothetical protein
MNNRLLVPRKTPGLLDLVPGAAAAYSLRSLSNSYADPVVTVRRSSDDAEGSFTAAEVSDGTLAAFCGAGDGLVTQWWDQSGNANHASQTTPGDQPKIVSSGVVILEEGKPAIQFDGTASRFDLPTISSQVRCDAFFVAAPSQFSGTTPGSANARFFDVIAGTVSFQFLRDAATTSLVMKNSAWQAGSNSTTFGVAGLGQQLYSASFKVASNTLHINGAQQSTSTAASAGSAGTVGKIGLRADGTTSTFFEGTFQELLLYFIDTSANRELLEGQIAWSYSQ